MRGEKQVSVREENHMIFPGRQERILADLERQLSVETPDLVARFAVFARLAQDEGPPPRELPGN
jgi:hypothetical protein